MWISRDVEMVVLTGARQNGKKFLLTGSEKFTLMKSVSESVAGRADIAELETPSLAEVGLQGLRRGQKLPSCAAGSRVGGPDQR